MFCENKNLEILIPKIYKHLKNIKFDLIIVDDDSNDGTKDTINKLKKRFKNLNVLIRLKKPRDLSKSCVMGFNYSNSELILVMDGDLQHNPIFIKKFLDLYERENCDFIIGSRQLFKKNQPGINFFRTFVSKILIMTLSNILNFKTTDPMSGFFLFKKKLYLKNKKNLYLKGYKILADLIYSTKEPIRIKEVNINFGKRMYGKSKINLKILIHLIIFILIRFFKKNEL